MRLIFIMNCCLYRRRNTPMEDGSLKVGQASLEQYVKLAPLTNAKPKEKKSEWTHMSAICAAEQDIDKMCVLALATGTKCLGANQVSPEGFSINDSHAEVLARRAFVRYLLLETIQLLDNGQSRFFELDETKKVQLKSNVSLHFYSTHTPCGDASIFPKTIPSIEDDEIDCCSAKRRKLQEQHEVVDDIHRTGAKCIASGPQDPMKPGTAYHNVGAFRTKPGRGDRTLSMSCSDKITKWCVMGIQGSLASIFVHPIYLSSLVFGSRIFSREAIERAVINRNVGFSNFSVPTVHHVPLKFDDGRFDGSDQCRPCSVSIVWHKGMDKAEHLVDGYLQGVTKSRKQSGGGQSCVSRRNMFQLFHRLCSISSEKRFDNKSYIDSKAISFDYQQQWTNLQDFYQHWIKDMRKLNVQKFSYAGSQI